MEAFTDSHLDSTQGQGPLFKQKTGTPASHRQNPLLADERHFALMEAGKLFCIRTSPEV